MMNQTLFSSSGPFFYNYTTRMMCIVGFGYIGLAVCLFGCVANVINMIVYYRLGLNQTTNLSLFALAVSDFGSIVVLIPLNVVVHYFLNVQELNFDPEKVPYLVTLWPHIIFTRITILLTAYITFERCLCVRLPMKVKTFITRRTVLAMIFIFCILAISSAAPIYYSSRLAYKFFPSVNQTRLGLVSTEDREEVEAVLGPINMMLVCLPFTFICVSTVVLVISLKKTSMWRNRTATGGNRENVTRKEMRVCKMVVIVAIMFIFCFIPSVIIQIVVLTLPNLGIHKERDPEDEVMFVTTTFIVVAGIILEATNSSINIFIYYKFSTRYQDMIGRMFPCIRKRQIE